MKKYLLLIFVVLLSLNINSCKDIITTEPRYDKELILDNLTPEDSLKLLATESLDLGTIKVKTSIIKNVIMKNISDIHNITIYRVDNKNKTGLFSYNLISGIPFEIKSNEDTEINPKIEITFIADPFVPGYFYDTLYFNDNQNLYIPIKVKTTY